MHDSLSETCYKLRSLLEAAVKRNLSDGILLSGGLDTSILAAIASKYTTLKAFTTAFEGAPAPDVRYARLVANYFNLKHFVKTFGKDELHDAILIVVKTLKSFDPMEIRNSLTIFISLKAAQENGVNSIMTGDGCDELFAGYNFLFGLEREELRLELQKLWNTMKFSSVDLADTLGIEVKFPYLDPEFKMFSMEIDPELKIRTERGQVWGKWILRKAFEALLPEEIIWRVKAPIEIGSGTTVLPNVFGATISDMEFEEKRQKYLNEDRVIVRNKEQLVYYEVYRSAIGTPHPENVKDKTCPYCNSNVDPKSSYCRTCGAYPV